MFDQPRIATGKRAPRTGSFSVISNMDIPWARANALSSCVVEDVHFGSARTSGRLPKAGYTVSTMCHRSALVSSSGRRHALSLLFANTPSLTSRKQCFVAKLRSTRWSLRASTPASAASSVTAFGPSRRCSATRAFGTMCMHAGVTICMCRTSQITRRTAAAHGVRPGRG